MTNARLFALVGAAALLAGTLLWHLGRPGRLPTATPAPSASIGASAIYAASFVDASGTRRALGQFQGKVLVVNFWATWCAPCRAEMPAFEQLHRQWAGRVQFVGLSDETPDVVRRFGEELGISYPLWTGGPEVSELSRRLGNAAGGLPHTVVLTPAGAVGAHKVGPYTHDELDKVLRKLAANAA